MGPRTALTILSVMPPAELASAVNAKDVARLRRIPGVGKKTAELLLLGLEEKLAALCEPPQAPGAPDLSPTSDANRLTGALTNMGFRATEAERAVESLGERVGKEPLSELLKAALATLT